MHQFFPNATGGGWSTTDYQRNYYDAFGRAPYKKLRDGTMITTNFDDLGRVTMVDAPGTADDVSFAYDNFGRVLSTTKNGDVISNLYNALSQRTSETTSHVRSPTNTTAVGGAVRSPIRASAGPVLFMLIMIMTWLGIC